jgi:hypothetical protein
MGNCGRSRLVGNQDQNPKAEVLKPMNAPTVTLKPVSANSLAEELNPEQGIVDYEKEYIRRCNDQGFAALQTLLDRSMKEQVKKSIRCLHCRLIALEGV